MGTSMKFPLNMIVGVIVLLLGLLFVEIQGRICRAVPPDAVVFMDDQSHTYLAPSCVEKRQGLRQGTVAEAWSLGYESEPKCREDGGFPFNEASLIVCLLQKCGFLKAPQDRLVAREYGKAQHTNIRR